MKAAAARRAAAAANNISASPRRLKAAVSAKRAAAAANTISPSPRRLTGAERTYLELKNGKGKSKFKSDRKIREEMQRRGFLKGKDPHGQLIMIASRARKKKGMPY